jgi:PAS domain-containing protein
LAGYAPAEIIGKSNPTLWHDADEVVARAKFLSHELGRTIEPGFEVFVAKARLGQIDENEWTVIRKDGSRFPVSLSVTALVDEAGKITGLLGVIADITKRRQTEEGLQKSEERVRLATEAAGIAVWAWHIKSGAIHWDE